MAKINFIPVILLLSFSAHASLSTRTTHGASWTCQVELKTDIMRVSVNPYYIDVEEDIVIAPYSASGGVPTGDPNTLEMFGRFNLPPNSAIVGLLLWNGDTLLKAKLKPDNAAQSQYESIVNRQPAPPPQPRDPIILEQISGTEYNLAIYPVAWGDSRKFRIRYLVPQSFDNGQLKIPLTFPFGAQVSKYPDWFQIDLKGSQGIDSAYVDNGTFLSNVKFPSTLMKPFSTTLKVIAPGGPFTAMAKVSIPSEAWQGNYVLFWSTVPDSLLNIAGLKIEVVFLWRWTALHTFVNWSGGAKNVSWYGNSAISQAVNIKNAVIDLTSGGTGRAGLILDKGDSNYTVFAPCARGSNEFVKMTEFLSGINSNYILSNIIGNESNDPGEPLSIDARNALRKKSAKEFDISLRLAFSLYSPQKNIVKHLVVVSAGPRLTDESPFAEACSSFVDPKWLEGVTLTSYGASSSDSGAYWPGVPMFTLAKEHSMKKSGCITNGFTIPANQLSNVTITLGNESKSYNFDVEGALSSKCFLNFGNFYFAGHSLSQWNSEIQWRAFDTEGKLLGEYTQKPPNIAGSGDTALLKMFASSAKAFSEVYKEGGLGPIFGIVDQWNSLLALPQDTLGGESASLLSDSGVPYLNPNEIFKPLKSEIAIKEKKDRLSNSSLEIFQNANTHNVTVRFRVRQRDEAVVKIFDITGRLIGSWTFKNIIGPWVTFTWNRHGLDGKAVRNGFYMIVVRSKDEQFVSRCLIVK